MDSKERLGRSELDLSGNAKRGAAASEFKVLRAYLRVQSGVRAGDVPEPIMNPIIVKGG